MTKMASHRVLRVAESIREIVSTAILHDLSDPRVKNVTVLRAEVSPDLRSSTVYVSVMGKEPERKLSMRGLDSAKGYLQRKVAQELDIRFAPLLRFELDESLQKSIEVSRLIDQAIASDREAADLREASQAMDSDSQAQASLATTVAEG